MPRIESQRMIADVEGDFVVFLSSMCINALSRVDRGWQAFSCMPKMLRELFASPQLGLLGYGG
ncbi:MAG: hypothetical protein WBL23_01980 [Salinisphaera sp.]|uniref:hypothetical protein n=1 Tax=Salinisphaera sp. TaxID=1914330 RepID=UPI003C7D72BA